jgi:Flp pilus assembly protein TadG
MSRPNSTTLKSRFELGQSLVEMTFGFLLLTVLMSGLLDIGRLYFVYVALEDSAGEAALYLSIFPDTAHVGTYGATDPASCGTMQETAWCRARNATGSTLLKWSNIDAANSSIILPAGGGVGETVAVTLAYNYEFITPLVRNVFGSGLTLSSTAEQTIIREL